MWGERWEEEGRGLECPICWEWFNIVENVPYVLWCGHTLCKNCILGLPWSVLKFPTTTGIPLHLPLFITCPWCALLSPRLLFRGTLSFPRKNFFLLSLVENMNPHPPPSPLNPLPTRPPQQQQQQNAPLPTPLHMPYSFSFTQILSFFLHLMAKLPLVAVFVLAVVYVIPACVAVLALYLLASLLLALPSFLVLYFAYPGLEWLVREIVITTTGRG